jgi:hypothetical protein
MSKTTRRASRVAFFCVTISAVLAIGEAAAAQVVPNRDDDMLDLVRRREKVEMQRVEAEIRQSLKEAQALIQSAPAKAVEKLKDAFTQVEKDTILSKERHEELKRVLSERIRAAESAALHQAAKNKQQPRQAPPAKKRNVEPPKPAELEDAKNTLNAI